MDDDSQWGEIVKRMAARDAIELSYVKRDADFHLRKAWDTQLAKLVNRVSCSASWGT